MRSLRMSQIAPSDRPPGGEINVTVEPSTRIPNEVGVYVAVNDHYALEKADTPDSCLRLIELLEEHFDSSLKRSGAIINHVIQLAGD